MVFLNRLTMHRPQKAIAAMIAFAMLCLVFAILLPKMIHPGARFSQDAIDGVDGLLYCISIGINLLALPLASRRRRCDAK
jgi:hypothetical protein